MIVVFTGGTGGAKLVQGLQQVVAPEELTVIVNTGDDIEWWGLHVSPDIDSVLYGLAGLLSTERGWGVENDSFRCLERMKQLGQAIVVQPGRSRFGDAPDAHRAAAGGQAAERSDCRTGGEDGNPRARAADVRRPGLDHARYGKGTLSFQEYFVRERHQVKVHAVRFEGAEARASCAGSARKHRGGGCDRFRTEQSGDQYRTDTCGAGNSRCPAAAPQASDRGGQPYRWRSRGFRACGELMKHEGLAQHDRGRRPGL